MNPTTQQIYNEIMKIKKNGNWIEASYRHIAWIPAGKVYEIFGHLDVIKSEHCSEHPESDEEWTEGHIVEKIVDEITEYIENHLGLKKKKRKKPNESLIEQAQMGGIFTLLLKIGHKRPTRGHKAVLGVKKYRKLWYADNGDGNFREIANDDGMELLGIIYYCHKWKRFVWEQCPGIMIADSCFPKIWEIMKRTRKEKWMMTKKH